MKTMKLNNRKEVLDFLNDTDYIYALKDYAYSLRDFFIHQSEHLIDAMAGFENEIKYCEETYGISNPKCVDLRLNHNNWADIDSWLFWFDAAIEKIVASEMKNPTTIEYEDGDDEGAMSEFIDAFTAKHLSPYLPYRPEKLMGIRAVATGMKDDDEFHEMLQFYN